MKKGPICLYKKPGETPLESLNRFRATRPHYAHVPMTYAGRLDPLAEGLLLALAGTECKKKDRFTKLDKEYELAVLFGVSTDTYDVLGLVQGAGQSIFDTQKIIECAETFIGNHKQSYPAFSSKTVAGKPLFEYAKKGTLKDIEIPQKVIEVYSIKPTNLLVVSKKDLEDYIYEQVASVRGDFRQKSIIQTWKNYFKKKSTPAQFTVAYFTVSASSGSYMRWLASSMGEHLGTHALALHIRRTKVGKYSLRDCIVN